VPLLSREASTDRCATVSQKQCSAVGRTDKTTGNPSYSTDGYHAAVIASRFGSTRPSTNVEGADPNRTDIALLILKDPVTWIAPTTLPTADFLDNLKQAGLLQAGPQGTLLTVVGYGRGLAFPPPENVPAISPDGYAHRNVAKTGYLGLNDAWLNTSQNLAAGYGGTAAGDSGGPVFWIDPEGNEHLVAITAWGGSLIGNGFYYRIDTAESLAFIQGVIGSLGSE
jgi:hypothetical protein